VRLRGQWALVTGAAKRVGHAIAVELAGRGANVVVHYNRSAAEADAAVRGLEALGVQACALRADLGQAEQVAALAAQAEARTGGIALLVNSAANYFRTPFDAVREADWDAALDVNLKAPFLLAWHLGRAMRARGEGCIVNVTDWAGERPYRDYLPYCVSKAGLIGLTKALAKELAPTVRVNAVSPGPVMLPEEFGAAEIEAVKRATPLGRVGSPEDVARAIGFLAEVADFSTGSVLAVDGGRLIG
jgi:NAD(P)-dependent dehydrogenase (short-subunit alcohol dehydrogenase family)